MGGARGRRVQETRGTRVWTCRRAARVVQGQLRSKLGSSAWMSSFAANATRSRTSSFYDTEGVFTKPLGETRFCKIRNELNILNFSKLS
jgi:hypothetical protein